MWERLFEKMAAHLIRRGSLQVALPSGQILACGDGTEPKVAITIVDDDTLRRILLDPEMGVGEAYMDGNLTIENDDLEGFLSLALANRAKGHKVLWQRALGRLRDAQRFWHTWNPTRRARRNVAHHYDLSDTLYAHFLDEDRQYSCAYFSKPDLTLEAAQEAKKAHIAGKLRLEAGQRVLDVGCGWGGMALTLARDYGVSVLGVTLSEEQHRVAQARAHEAGLDGQVEFRLMDYRDVQERFDRIVSVGMFEHVGAPHYREYFSALREKLTEDGIALIHTIGRMAPPGHTSAWIAKYIFPGGYIPAMSEVVRAIEKEQLWTTDIEVWRLHYAETLKHWHQRFRKNKDKIRAIYDDRFCRMWRYYLVASEQAFRHDRQCVFQFQISRQQQAVPLTRDYLYRNAAKSGSARAAAE